MSNDSQTRPGTAAAPPGEDQPSRLRLILDTHSKPVLFPSVAIVLAFVALAIARPTWLKTTLGNANTGVVNGIGWYYVLLVTSFVVFSLYVGFSRWGDIVLGSDDESAQYSFTTWLAMLFAAGMGIGLVFWGVAEPLNHFAAPPPGSAADSPANAAQSAMSTTFLHWGLHAWAIYVVVGLAIALAVHRRNRPVSMRWALEPVLGTRVRGWLGHVIDIVAIVGTLFGVATSLGFGVTQLSAGFEYLGLDGASENTGLILALIAGIIGLATISVVTGLDVGIKWLSNINLVLAGVLMVVVLLLGPSLFILRELVQNLGVYIQDFIRLSFRTMPYQGEPGETWLGAWTTYYWGWWMSWSPFVGIFIARISKGRTVREFIGGVLLVPTMLTFVWFSILGGAGIYRELFAGGGLVDEEGAVSTNTALFQLLDTLPGAAILAGLFLLLIVIFFVTSADSGAFVVDMLASGGDENPPAATRAMWAILAGLIAGVLIWVGSQQGSPTDGLSALQTMAILVAAPFSLVMIGMCLATAKYLHHQHRRMRRLETAAAQREIERTAVEAVSQSANGSSPVDLGGSKASSPPRA